ncbi:uncharacterized protein MKZ38_010471 [Zalerion maritima]|uniref:Nephrocystin 3-like N-terminal domain-containing protein n=1 Tax=Zalerion maritima TaxID=339359 RepID=A0AAD5RS98_9PEZI|nr:uncharacterized protein MKZ38_010471 [Zalerion maritima]
MLQSCYNVQRNDQMLDVAYSCFPASAVSRLDQAVTGRRRVGLSICQAPLKENPIQNHRQQPQHWNSLSSNSPRGAARQITYPPSKLLFGQLSFIQLHRLLSFQFHPTPHLLANPQLQSNSPSPASLPYIWLHRYLFHSSTPWRRLAASCRDTAKRLIDELERIDPAQNSSRQPQFVQNAKRAIKLRISRDTLDSLDRCMRDDQLNLHSGVLISTMTAVTSTASALESNLPHMHHDLQAIIQQFRGGEIPTRETLRARVDKGVADINSRASQINRHISYESGQTRRHITEELSQHNERLRQKKQSDEEEKQQREFLDSLLFLGATERTVQVRDATPGTLEWIFSREEGCKFREFLRSGQLFTVFGNAGSGKSTVMRYLVEHGETRKILEEHNPGTSIVKFYCWRSSSSQLEHNAEGLLRSLTWQLLHERPKLLKVHYPRHRQKDQEKLRTQTWRYSDLERLFQEAIQEVQGKVCIFIDGLDELAPDSTSDTVLNMCIKNWKQNKKPKSALETWDDALERLGSLPNDISALYAQMLERTHARLPNPRKAREDAARYFRLVLEFEMVFQDPSCRLTFLCLANNDELRAGMISQIGCYQTIDLVMKTRVASRIQQDHVNSAALLSADPTPEADLLVKALESMILEWEFYARSELFGFDHLLVSFGFGHLFTHGSLEALTVDIRSRCALSAFHMASDIFTCFSIFEYITDPPITLAKFEFRHLSFVRWLPSGAHLNPNLKGAWVGPTWLDGEFSPRLWDPQSNLGAYSMPASMVLLSIQDMHQADLLFWQYKFFKMEKKERKKAGDLRFGR